MKTNYLILQTR